MNFLDLQQMVMADRFNQNELGDIKNWINYVGGLIWDADNWTFRIATATVQTDSTGTVTNLPSNFGAAKSLRLSDGTRLTPIHDPDDFDDRYFGTTTVASNTAEAYTVSGSTMKVGPPVALTGMQLRHQMDWPFLVADSDIPALPVETHVGLGIGAAKWGQALKSDPSWLGLDSAIPEVMGTLRANYLSSIDDKRGRQSPAYRARVS